MFIFSKGDFMHCTHPLPHPPLSEAKVLHTLDTLRSVVALDEFIHLVVIRNGTELLQWCAAPNVCDRRLNVILTLTTHSQSLRAATRRYSLHHRGVNAHHDRYPASRH